MVPSWLHLVAGLSLATGFLIAGWIAWDEWHDPQHMWIMNVVWPITALFGTVIALAGYLRYGRLASRSHMMAMKKGGEGETPFPVMVAKGASHCGSGCTLGDLLAEWLAYFVPVVAVWFGWHTVFAEKMFAVWILDFIFAFVIGVAFQYFTIKPMRQLSVGQGLVQAVKADTLSLTAWQVGMYGFMAIAQFILFRRLLGTPLEVASMEFWFMMQLAMIAGFITSYPVNWWLLHRGIKEKM
ncbi:DUF4396 domain-containing protein [Ancylobacter sp. MQZ15Z-1]|uniref:DUF4396 domain-containing protein n=1 Tax=Ancylobacter mangrovi TaxID=2972472 RepID=A0A9X2PAW8_9HYPH|nr:DUF4396 domain-containing protein [Ancylobacter mangrovi]MCS0493999.1 DUF4396 domain-containing protein [Ancylobacter mangrovi]